MQWTGFQNYSDDSLFGVISSSINKNDGGRQRAATEWSFEENKQFVDALAESDLSSPNFLKNVASRLPWKSADDAKNHYQALLHDLEQIKPRQVQVPVPQYKDNAAPVEARRDFRAPSPAAGKRKATVSRRRGIPWTEEEHHLFLMGLNRYGKGDWRSISRNYVITKTPTQVASHAQKYFRRQASNTPAERRRPSIHDIQTVNPAPVPIPNPAPVPPSFSSSALANFMASNVNVLQPPPMRFQIPDYVGAYGQGSMFDPAGHGLLGGSSTVGVLDTDSIFFPTAAAAAAGPSSPAFAPAAFAGDHGGAETSGAAGAGCADGFPAFSSDYLFSANRQPRAGTEAAIGAHK